VKGKYRKLILFTLSLIIASSLYADEGEKKIPIIVNGDKVEYFQDERKVIGSGNIEITYEDVRLTCDKIVVEMDTKEALAEGNVKLFHKESVHSGEKATYNFETKKGGVVNASLSASPWYGKGELIERTGASEYCVKKGYISTCEKDPPHYKIQTRQVKIFLDDKVTATNTVMYIGGVPILYMPFYVHLLSEKRPGVTVTPGYDREWGGFALTSWRYTLNDYIKGYVHTDYREKRDFASGIDTKYNTKYLGEGLLETYYMNERTIHAKRIWDDRDEPTTERERYKLQLRHKWRINPDMVVTGEYHKFSDETFLKDYYYRDYESDENPATYISGLRQRPFYSAEFIVNKRANHYETSVERLPEFNFDMEKDRLFNTNFYYTTQNSVTNLDKKYGDDSQQDLDVIRVDTYDELSYLVKPLDLLSISPYIATRQTYYSKDMWGEEDFIRGTFYTGVDVSTRFFKTFECNTDIFGLDINGLHHIVNPVVRYYYNHHPTILPANLMQFDDFDNIDRKNGIRFEFENKLQTKRENINNPGTMDTIELARLLVTTDYLFKVEQGSEFTDFDAELELRPYRWLYMESDLTYDHTKAKIEKAGWDLIAKDPRPEDKWRFSIGQRYELEHSSQLTSELSYKLSPKWRVRVYERFQFKENSLKEQEYSITRDLHCWDAEFLFNARKPEEKTFWFILRLKAFPNIPIKASTSYHKPKTELQNFGPQL